MALFKSFRTRVGALGVAGLLVGAMAAQTTGTVATEAIRPSVSDWQLLSASTTPPTQAQCA